MWRFTFREIKYTRNLVRVKPRPNDRNMPTQHVATLLGATCCVRLATVLRCVATCWVLLAQVWKWSNRSQQHPTSRNMSQQAGQTHATCCAQQCCDMLRWYVAIVWPGLKVTIYSIYSTAPTLLSLWEKKISERPIPRFLHVSPSPEKPVLHLQEKESISWFLHVAFRWQGEYFLFLHGDLRSASKK